MLSRNSNLTGSTRTRVADMKTSSCKKCGRKFRQRIRGRKYFCKKCRQKRNAEQGKHRATSRMKRYNARLAADLCPECGGHRNSDGLKCKPCRAKNKDSQQRMITKDKRNLYMRRLHNRRRREGMCANCGQRPPVLGGNRGMCAKCRKKRREHYKYKMATDPVFRRQKYEASRKPPKPVCKLCKLQRLRCSCNKMMSVRHAVLYACIWRCAKHRVRKTRWHIITTERLVIINRWNPDQRNVFTILRQERRLA